MALRFEWDAKKAAANLLKHRMSFDEATTVFDDPAACIFHDEAHSLDEHREIIGHSAIGRLAIVCFTERKEDCVRLFSARPATRSERHDHEENATI